MQHLHLLSQTYVETIIPIILEKIISHTWKSTTSTFLQIVSATSKQINKSYKLWKKWIQQVIQSLKNILEQIIKKIQKKPTSRDQTSSSTLFVRFRLHRGLHHWIDQLEERIEVNQHKIDQLEEGIEVNQHWIASCLAHRRSTKIRRMKRRRT